MSKENAELLVLFLIGLFLIIYGNYKHTQYKKLVAFGTKSEGTVIRLEISGESDGVNYSPKVSYIGSKGQQIIKQYEIGSNPAPYKVGDSITIYYDAIDDGEFIIDDKRSKFLGLALIIIGSAMIVISLVQYFYNPILAQ